MFGGRGAALVCLGAITLSGWVAGCGGGARRRAVAARKSRPASALATAQTTHEYPSPPPAPERAPGAAGPVQAVTAFAELYINWNAEDVSGRMTRLARASIDQARSEMVLAAAETRADSTLEQGGIGNRGTVEAVAPRTGYPRQYVVVTRESTVATATAAYRGLAPAWHLTLATVSPIGRQPDTRWVVSGWQPES